MLNQDEQQLADQIKGKAYRGASAMLFRQALILALNFIASIALSRLLFPSDFGIYVVTSFVVNVVILFTDVGLGASLIRAKNEPTQEQYQAIFSFQLALVLLIVLLIFLAAPFIVAAFKAQPGMVAFIRFMSLTLLMTPVATISSIKIERQLAYGIFAKVDVFAVICDKVAAISLAAAGFGFWSFGIGAFLNTLVRAFATYRAAPWTIGLHFDLPFLKETMKFGGLFQLGAITSLFRDNLNAMLIGPLFGPRPVGYLNWAHNIAMQGSQVFTAVVSRVNFPSLARAQEHPEILSEILEKTLKVLNVVTLPLLFVSAALIEEIVVYVYSPKWLEAVPAFYCYVFVMACGNVTTTLSGFLLAIGEAKRNLKILSCWTVLLWTVSLVLVPLVGYVGVAVSAATVIFLVSVWFLREARRRIALNLTDMILKPMAASGTVACGVFVVKGFLAVELVGVLLLAVTGVLLSFLLSTLLDRGLRKDLAAIRERVLNPRAKGTSHA